MKTVFITGTGTDVGKTFVACGLIGAARRRGFAVQALKPVATGFDEAAMAASDPAQLLNALGRPATLEEIAAVSPWRYREPLSPHMAAPRAGAHIDMDAVVEFSRTPRACDLLLIEGVGGIMVPLGDRCTTLDWMKALKLPVILVAGSYLGTISHTLTALAVLRHAALQVAAVVISESEASTVALDETAATITAFGATKVLALARDARAQGPVFAELADLVMA